MGIMGINGNQSELTGMNWKFGIFIQSVSVTVYKYKCKQTILQEAEETASHLR